MIEISRCEKDMSKEEARDILQTCINEGEADSPFYLRITKKCKLISAMKVAVKALEEDVL